MKNNRFLLALALLLTAPALNAQVQPIPDDVTNFVFENCKAVIVPDTVTGFEDGLMNAGTGVRVAGGEMKFYGDQKIRLHLCLGRGNSFTTLDNAEVTFKGSFHFPDYFNLTARDASTVVFEGLSDTVSAKTMSISLYGVARVNVKNRLVTEHYSFSAKKSSRLKVFIVELTTASDAQEQMCYVNQSEHASVNIKYRLFPGLPQSVDPKTAEAFFAEDGDLDIDFDDIDLDDFDADDVADLARKIKLRLNRRTWNPNIDFAWGFHNWAKERFNGLAGTDDDAAVRTSFNHILLTFNYPVVYSRRVALYVGLGMEWDKYKFHRGDIHFDQTTEPYHFVNGTVANSESRLLTRYVILPIAVKFDLGRHWKAEIAAIPGLHWSGSHTGLRRDITSGDDETNIKDYSVNKYIAPYKLDARIAVQYRSVGVYFQTAMLPAFKGSCEELFPVKFGIIF